MNIFKVEKPRICVGFLVFVLLRLIMRLCSAQRIKYASRFQSRILPSNSSRQNYAPCIMNEKLGRRILSQNIIFAPAGAGANPPLADFIRKDLIRECGFHLPKADFTSGGLACGLGHLGVSHHARGVIQDPRFRFATLAPRNRRGRRPRRPAPRARRRIQIKTVGRGKHFSKILFLCLDLKSKSL